MQLRVVVVEERYETESLVDVLLRLNQNGHAAQNPRFESG